jgi:hypothetical protein
VVGRGWYRSTRLQWAFRHTTVQEGAEITVHPAMTGPNGPAGGYFATDGPVPW